MRTINYFLGIMMLASLLFSGCKYDDSDLWDELDKQAAQIAALEAWQTTVNSQISSLQGLITALEANDYVTGVTPVTQSGVTVGYTITFTKSAAITIYHGTDGADGTNGTEGHSPVIGVAQHTDGKYYWTLDGEWLTDDGTPTGTKIPVTGNNGADGSTPKVAIGTDGVWYISANGTATGTPPAGTDWTSTGVKATGPQGQTGATGATGATGTQGDAIFAANGVDYTNNDYVVFTLAGPNPQTKIRVPKYKAIGISFTQPTEFTPSTSQVIGYTVSGTSEEPNNIIIAGLPAGWKYEVNYTDKEITVTAALRITEGNYTGEAAVLVGTGNQASAMYSLSVSATLNFSGAAKNEVGGIYYQNGIPTGVVYAPNNGTAGSGRVVSLARTTSVLPWSNVYVTTGAISDDGLVNMAMVKSIDNDFSDYPPFAWVDALNGTPGSTSYMAGAIGIWYLPSTLELGNHDGGFYKAINEYGITAFDASIITAGGIQVDVYNHHWTSVEQTQYAAKGVVLINIHESFWTKSSDGNARAICKF